ncbi:MAG: SEC-C domain-containing protein [Candidatus Omnitrophica bacterium]|nr:SEC-C domain-containing protein [Candidatus Omnitrophota bacterium]
MLRYQFSNISAKFWDSVLEEIGPYVKGPKVGRNQSCPCGSGRKYKVCCLREAKESLRRMDFDRCFLKNGDLTFRPPKFGVYSDQEMEDITKYILRVERVVFLIKSSRPEQIGHFFEGMCFDCELLIMAAHYLETGNKDKAMKFFARVAESDEVDPCVEYFDMFQNLMSYWRNKDIDEAIYFMKHRMRKTPCDEDHDPDMDERDLADLYIAKGDKEKGIRMFEDLIKRHPDNIWNYNCAAICLQYGGEYQLAKKFVNGGIKLAQKTRDPEDLLPQLKDILKKIRERRD